MLACIRKKTLSKYILVKKVQKLIMTMLQSENGESICEGNGSDKEKSVSSVQDVREASPAFRTRTLVNADDVFNHNAWCVEIV